MGVKFLNPLQQQLLTRGHCVACLMPLSKAKREDIGNGKEKVTCKCDRIFIYDQKEKKYRRANLDEV